MVILEMSTFNEVYENIRKLENWHVANLVRKNDLAMQYSQIEFSDQLTFGFFEKVPKLQKLAKMRSELSKVDADLRVGEELLKLVYSHVLEFEIPSLLVQKKYRLKEIINDFSEQKVRKIKKELNFWKNVVEIPCFDVENEEVEENK